MKTTAITNETIFSMNWAHGDRRSVKASLHGWGSGRVLWWKINQAVSRLAHRSATLEEIMLAFHARHHRLTLSCLKYRLDVNAVAAQAFEARPLSTATLPATHASDPKRIKPPTCSASQKRYL